MADLNEDANTLVEESLKKNLKLSVLEGAFGTVMGTFIGGVFLTGFALLLGANDMIIGLLAALPAFANLIQIVGSYIISKVGSSKRVCIVTILLHRLTWGIVTGLPFILFTDGFYVFRVWIFVLFLGVSSIFASLSGVAWMSWMADLVPREMRGRFFALRNMWAQAVGMILAVLGGKFMDEWRGRFAGNELLESYGFSILFGMGVIFGLASIVLISRIQEPQRSQKVEASFLHQLKRPFLDPVFKKFMRFSVVWGFCVAVSGPFFGVYMIKTLGVPFSTISIFGLLSGITNIVGTRFWARFIDTIGSKPILIICGMAAALVPVLWIFAAPGQYAILFIIHILSGLCWSGIGLASGAMMMNIAPAKSNSVYFAVFAAVTGLSGAVAPIVGGVMGELFQGLRIGFGQLSIADLQLLFLASSILRLLSLLLLRTIPIVEKGNTRDLLRSMQRVSEYLPIYSIQNHAAHGVQYLESMTSAVSRGTLDLERKWALILTKGEGLGRRIGHQMDEVDQHVDAQITRYEDGLDRVLSWGIDKLEQIFKLDKGNKDSTHGPKDKDV